VVITPDWDQPVGTLYPLAWQDSGWQVAEPPIPVLIGKNGLGWGIGLADYRDRQGPVKREGDLKSPAGIFTLGTAFGYAPAQAAGFLRMPYVHVSETLMCIEDTGSQAYNRIVDQAQTPVDWSSTDQMRRKDDLYEWGMLVEHNYEPSLPGGGSCIFLHVWREGGRGTAGCTSMDKARLRQLLAWLDPAAAPLLLQAPTRQYPALAQILDLPALP
jgi:D-alanyl-D-alanine dipeptidase